MSADFETAFAAFLTAAQEKARADYVRFMPEHPEWAPRLVAERGKRYVRIVSESVSSRAAWAFVDSTNGDVLKADGWKRPAKGPRGNIHDSANGIGRVFWTGVR